MPELFKAVREASAAVAATAETDPDDLLNVERVEGRDDPKDPAHAFMVQRRRFPMGDVVGRRRFYLVGSEIVVCDGVELPLDNSDVLLAGRASAAGAGLLELLELVNKHGVVEELKWRPLRGKPPVSPQEFARLALADLLFPGGSSGARRLE